MDDLTFTKTITFAFAAQFVRDFGIDDMPVGPLCGITVFIVLNVFLLNTIRPRLAEARTMYPKWENAIAYVDSLCLQTIQVGMWVAGNSVVRIASGMQMASQSASVVLLFAINAAGTADFRRPPAARAK